jgi:hypothetical protein
MSAHPGQVLAGHGMIRSLGGQQSGVLAQEVLFGSGRARTAARW